MTTTFHISPSKLDIDFLTKIKSFFGEKKLIISVEEDDDATTSLLSTEGNRNNFKQSIHELNTGNLITVSPDDLRK